MAEVALLPSFNGSANLKGTGQGDPDLFGRRPGFESRHLSFGMETAQKDGELVPPPDAPPDRSGAPTPEDAGRLPEEPHLPPGVPKAESPHG